MGKILLFKAKTVKHPGSRGSIRWWMDQHGTIRYDERPGSKTAPNQLGLFDAAGQPTAVDNPPVLRYNGDAEKSPKGDWGMKQYYKQCETTEQVNAYLRKIGLGDFAEFNSNGSEYKDGLPRDTEDFDGWIDSEQTKGVSLQVTKENGVYEVSVYKYTRKEIDRLNKELGVEDGIRHFEEGRLRRKTMPKLTKRDFLKVLHASLSDPDSDRWSAGIYVQSKNDPNEYGDAVMAARERRDVLPDGWPFIQRNLFNLDEDSLYNTVKDYYNSPEDFQVQISLCDLKNDPNGYVIWLDNQEEDSAPAATLGSDAIVSALPAPEPPAEEEPAYARGEWKHGGYNRVTELVPIPSLLPFREYRWTREDSRKSPEDWDELKADMAANGLREPIIMLFNPQNGAVKLGEGNHRLAIARELGWTHIPVRMLRNRYLDERNGGVLVPDAMLAGMSEAESQWVESDQHPRAFFPTRYFEHDPDAEKRARVDDAGKGQRMHKTEVASSPAKPEEREISAFEVQRGQAFADELIAILNERKGAQPRK